MRNVKCLRVTKADRELKGLLSLFLLTDENEKPDAIAVVTKIIND